MVLVYFCFSVFLQKLPKVNKELAEKLLDAEESILAKKTEKRAGLTLLKDDRFSAMFKNPDFQIEKESEEYKLLNPVVSKLDKAKKKKQDKLAAQFEEVDVSVFLVLAFLVFDIPANKVRRGFTGVV